MLMFIMCERQKEQKQKRACEKRAIFMSLWRNTEES